MNCCILVCCQGRYQTVFRAELYAVIVALAIFKKVHIHSDNSAVAKGINHIIQHGYQHAKWANHPDKDLFKTAANFLRQDGERQVKVEWVKAHRELSEATGTLDLWQIFHNSRADHWAGYCFKSSIPTEIAEARDVLRQNSQNDLSLRTAATRVLRAIMDEF